MMRYVLVWGAMTWLLAGSVSGATNARDEQREAEIEKEFAQVHPELLEPFRAARVAYDNKDYAEATHLLRDITARAPDCDVAFRRLGSSLLMQGKRAEGLQFCEKAVALNRSAGNLTTLAFHLFVVEPNPGKPGTGQPRPQPPGESRDAVQALALLQECRTKPGGTDLSTLMLTAQVALEVQNLAEFRWAADLLARTYSNEALTHYFAAVEAAIDRKWLKAEKEIKQAEKLGLAHPAAQRFLDSGVHSRAVRSRIVLDAMLVFPVWLGGLVLLFGAGFVLSKLTLRQIEHADPQAAITGGERLIRKCYRVVLNIAGVYYYVSLPVVVVLVIGVVGLIIYLFLAIGRIPIKLTALLVIGALFTVFAMIKSLFIKVEASDPGRSLQRPEAEGLWQLAEEVAGSVGTRPVDEIRITPGTDLAVYERGSWREKLRNQARRVLVLGTGVLTGFKQNDFRCVLAHEYGHFSNRDTAGGEIGLRVRQDMLKFFIAMYQAGQATSINLAFHFLRAYQFIFRRISHGATRLQEVLADRVAAQIYGAPAFEAGLTHVIRRSIEFEAAANSEIEQSIESHRPLQNLYELPVPDGKKVDNLLEKALSRPTTQDDTHPGPRDRFRLVARLRQPSCASRAGDVWDLFADPEGVRREMLAEVEKRIAQQRDEEPVAETT